MSSEPKFIVLLGPPGAGKGTQAALLQETLGVPHVASGDLFREHLLNKTKFGRQVVTYIERGELVPDDLTTAMVMERLSQSDCQHGALLDGFPRTIGQAMALDQALSERGQRICRVLSIVVPDEVLVERLSGRRVCRSCGAVYHVIFNPPHQDGRCDRCGGELYQRDDDRPGTVRYRLKVYWEQTSPLIEYYKQRGMLTEINGDQPIEKVEEELKAAVTCDGRG